RLGQGRPHEPLKAPLFFVPTSSTSKITVAFGGTKPFPSLPYPSSGGIVSLRFPPTRIGSIPFPPPMPSSQPGMTLLLPNLSCIGGLLSVLSISVPSVSQPL